MLSLWAASTESARGLTIGGASSCSVTRITASAASDSVAGRACSPATGRCAAATESVVSRPSAAAAPPLGASPARGVPAALPVLSAGALSSPAAAEAEGPEPSAMLSSCLVLSAV